MRAILFVSGTVALTAVGALLVWRPVLALSLALIGGAVSFWRMHRPQRTVAVPAAMSRPKRVTPVRAPVLVEEEPETQVAPPVLPHADLMARVRKAGWNVATAQADQRWIVAECGGVRVALRPAPAGPRATGEDIFDAMAAKARENAQYAAIVCENRPMDAVAALARDSKVHIVNLARLEAYLALAGSFKPSAAPAPAPRRVSA